MSFESFLSNLREKPEHVRTRYAFWTSFCITAVIFVFWLGSFSGVRGQAEEIVASKVLKAGTPAETLVASVGAFLVDIKELVIKPKTVNFSTVQVRAGNR